MFEFQSRSPSPALKDVVDKFFITRADIPTASPVEKTLLPSIMQSLLLNLNATPQFIAPPSGEKKWHASHLLLGQYTKSFSTILSGSIRFIGVHFTPTGLYQLVGSSAAAYADRVIPVVDAHWTSFFDSLCNFPLEKQIALLEDWLLQKILPVDESCAIVAQAAKSFIIANGASSIEAVARQVGMSERSLQRHFQTFVGVSPKKFNRVVRFNAVTRLIELNAFVNWKTIFYVLGYADHAHFVNDFRQITGSTPSQYFKEKTAYEKFFYGS